MGRMVSSPMCHIGCYNSNKLAISSIFQWKCSWGIRSVVQYITSLSAGKRPFICTQLPLSPIISLPFLNLTFLNLTFLKDFSQFYISTIGWIGNIWCNKNTTLNCFNSQKPSCISVIRTFPIIIDWTYTITCNIVSLRIIVFNYQ